MDNSREEGTDKSSIKPVSSLLSKFEGFQHELSSTATRPNASIATSKTPPPQPPAKPATHKQPPPPPAARKSSEAPRPSSTHHPESKQRGETTTNNGPASANLLRQPLAVPSSRPISMQMTPSSCSTPERQRSPNVQVGPRATQPGSETGPASQVPHNSLTSSDAEAFRIKSHTNLEPSRCANGISTANLQDVQSPAAKSKSDKSIPPPVNRAAKPGLSGADLGLKSGPGSLNQPERSKGAGTSPFTTPPASESSSNGDEGPPVPLASKLRAPHMKRSTEHPGEVSNNEMMSSAMRPPRTSSINPKCAEYAQRRSKSDNVNASSDDVECRPRLPPRHQLPGSEVSSPLDISRPSFTRQSLDLPSRPSALTQGFSPGSFPPRRENHRSVSLQNHPRDSVSVRKTSVTPPPRAKQESSFNPITMRPSPAFPESKQPSQNSTSGPTNTSSTSGFPNSSRANRKPPVHAEGPTRIETGYDTRQMDACGEYICTSGTSTRAWHIPTGKQIMNMAHPEGVKVTALVFRPSRDIQEEGQIVWLGTNYGEIMEVDIITKSVVALDERTHSRREVVKMWRKASEIWTLDSDGKLFVWPSGEHGNPQLNTGILNGRACRGVTSSVIVGNKLWLAAGKSIRVFQPNTNPGQISFEVTQDALAGPSSGDVTSCAYLSGDPDRIYFGHSDGKISIFSKRDNKHIETSAVSLYKVSCLAGVGDYLWAGFNNGSIMVFDTKTRPWTTRKYWQAHTHPVASIQADRGSLWKLGRFHVLSLGVDSMIGVWDGMLEADWIAEDMQVREAEYCTYKDVSALVLTWNAGASKPSDLRYDQQNSNFFREFLSAEQNPPDIIVFGLQELVDLEDKKLTAKSFFKGKSKDSYGHEHLSRVYREWRDYLTKCLDDCMPQDESYVQLHTASLVGLFTCVFVRTSHRARIRDPVGAEIKTGMGGLHGNKGSLIFRFMLDDTSICFANCHLAAGQTATVHRNQDVQAILGSECLPPGRRTDIISGTYVLGGDGSMIMDHEICIFNGDLNYRIDTMGRDTVLQAIKGKNLQKLLERDQLLLSRKKNPDFRLRDFYEPQIEFLPTYKYDVGTDNYDSSDKRRAPAWCDRVLCRGDKAIQPLQYRRHEIRVSDHRPVSASFKVRIKTRQPDACDQIRMACEKRFEKLKRTVADDSKTEYLKAVFGVSEQEARQLLRSS